MSAINLRINGRDKRLEVAAGEMLLDTLRNAGYHSVKRGCEAGTCGTCVVLVDGQPQYSCILFSASVDGREITTVEGLGGEAPDTETLDGETLGRPEKYHPIMRAFAQEGAVQCGYCIPGMLLTTLALLEDNPDPTDDEIKVALDGHLCRCTGYVKQIAAVKRAAQLCRSEQADSPLPEPQQAEQQVEDAQAATGGFPKHQVVGTSQRKLDALSLAAGRAEFTDDIHLPGLLHAKVLWSPLAHARIKSIDVGAARALRGVICVLTHEDVPRALHTTAGQGAPEPSPYDTAILDNKVRFVGDRVAAVAATSRAIAERAIKLIRVEYEPLEPVFDIREADADGAAVIHDEPDCRAAIPVPYEPQRNIAARVDMRFGDLETGFRVSDIVVEEEVETQYAQHTPLEPHITICYLDPQDRLIIRSSTQVPFHVRRIVGQSLGVPIKRIRVVKPRIGGGFGAKQEVLEDLVAALCLKCRQPVKLEYTRAEEFVSTRTRHPAVVRVKLGFDTGGKLLALHLKVRTNTGAYGSHALTVACNAGAKTLPLYRCDNVGFDADAVYTNLPVAGAYRGYGGTQGAFGLEVAMDEAAHRLGIDPVELRAGLHIQAGESSPVFRALGEGKEGVEQSIGSCGLARCLTLGAEAIDWKAKRSQPRDSGRYRRGVGMCVLMQGSSIPEIDMGAASLKMNEDGSFNLLVGAADLGTGSDTVLAQIAAEALGTRLDQIVVYSADTDLTPFDVGAYASSTTYLSGEAVRKTALAVREQILKVAADMLGCPETNSAQQVTLGQACVTAGERSVTFAEIARHALYVHDQFQIGAMRSSISHVSPPPFAAHFAHVELDMRIGRVKLLHYVAAVDCGTAINPQLAEGQIEGAVVNGIGYALTEEMCFAKDGRCLNPNLRYYRIPGPRDLPRLTTILVPTFEPTGPYGAKSVSEICINGPLPVLSNAIFHATGARIRKSPFTAERVLGLVENLKE